MNALGKGIKYENWSILMKEITPNHSLLGLAAKLKSDNDIPRPQTGAQLALFANNSALYLRSSNFRQITPRLQKAIDKLSRWFKTWRIEVNPEKSATIYFN
ncbi:hypothetical protein EVAR_97550_1 [Eumeta japonica]|uniref:RNA-directed DNA polymerase from mobile element jockey n=1 Tax=Eumeta variegata TaxID=151549 RepID=A0A4C1SD02_EUMVA|nr:hypothetical protein EVAR_97550_1 [Eumeta japonica]